MSSSSSSASGQSYEGCIKEKHGKFWLVSNDGTKYQLNSTQDLSAHKNHEVKITGDAGSASASSSAVSSSDMSGKSNKKDKDANAQTLNVTNVEMVSTSCSANGKAAGNASGANNNGQGSSNPR
ncbi:MAG: hypothetical protein JOZ43_01945 [Acidobacteriales bacterium]|nr:hypothetical protein [Terriglobales bacterium]